MGTGDPRVRGTKANQSRIANTPSTSLGTIRWVTPARGGVRSHDGHMTVIPALPLLCIIWMPPSCALDE